MPKTEAEPVTAESLDEILPNVYRWAAFSTRHRVELTSHACLRDGLLTVLDPIRLRGDLHAKLLAKAKDVQVFLTSENHQRAAAEWGATKAAVRARQSAGFASDEVTAIPDSSLNWCGYQVVPLDGGAAGECALVDTERRIAFCGDAVVNLTERGLEVLPEKYCRDRALLKAAIRALAESDIEWLLPAHGQPIGPDATGLLRGL